MIHVLANADAGLWMPEQASTVAPGVDQLFYFILWLCVTLFVGIALVLAVFVWKFHGKPGQPAQKAPAHSTALEMTWTVIPTIVVMVIFYMGFRGYLDMTTPPPNAYEIRVTASMWQWRFTYPNGHGDSVLHVPVDRPVRLILESKDVIHSLYVPVFRVKKDCVPGRLNYMWFHATREGEFDLFCTEYCGVQHSTMITKVVVQEPDAFAKWLQDASNKFKDMPELSDAPEVVKQYVDAGMSVYTDRCRTCHSIDGSVVNAPSFKGLFGSTRSFINSPDAIANEEYIRESILNPGGKVVKGYGNVMPPFQGQIEEKEISALIEYIRTLK